MTNLDSIFKSRDITLPTKVCLVKAMDFPVVMYGCESWTVKKAERWRIDAFELWCWRRLLRVPWTAGRSNQSNLKEISPGISLEGMMLKLKLHYFGHLMWKVDSLEKTLMLGGIGGRRRRGWQRMRWMASLTWWTWVWVNSGSWWWTGRPGVLWFMGSQRVGHDWATELYFLPEKAMAPHSSILAWKIPWTEGPGGLQSMGSHRVGHNWNDLASAAAAAVLSAKKCTFFFSIFQLLPSTRSSGAWHTTYSPKVYHGFIRICT